jgi:hypothetical protein
MTYDNGLASGFGVVSIRIKTSIRKLLFQTCFIQNIFHKCEILLIMFGSCMW